MDMEVDELGSRHGNVRPQTKAWSPNFARILSRASESQ